MMSLPNTEAAFLPESVLPQIKNLYGNGAIAAPHVLSNIQPKPAFNNYKSGKGKDQKSFGKGSAKSTTPYAKKPKVEENKCTYCFGRFHNKSDCKFRIRDELVNIFRKDVQSKPTQTVNSIKATSSHFQPMEIDFPAMKVKDLLNQFVNCNPHNLWVLDSGCGRSITGSPRLKLSGETQENISFKSPLPNSNISLSEHNGNAFLSFDSSLGSVNATVPNMYYVPGWSNNILSMHTLRTIGFSLVESKSEDFLIFKKDSHLVVARQMDGIFYIIAHPNHKSELVCSINMSIIEDDELTLRAFREWHLKLGHIGKDALIKTMSKRLIDGIPYIPSSKLNKIEFQCKTCSVSKHNRRSYRNKEGSRPEKPFEVIHSDTMNVGVNGWLFGTYGRQSQMKYIQNFVDDATSYKWIFISQNANADETLRNIKSIQAMATNQFGQPLKCFRSDNGTEYINQDVKEFLNSKGIKFQQSNPYCQEENGSSERYNQTLMNYARTMLAGAGMASHYWPEAVSHAHYILNRIPTRRLKMSPFEALTKKKPDLGTLPIWGSVCYAHVPEEHRPHKKLLQRAVRSLFLGYDMHHKNSYRLLNLETKSIFISADIKFNRLYIDKLVSFSFDQENPLLTTEELRVMLRASASKEDATEAKTAGACSSSSDDAKLTKEMLTSGGDDTNKSLPSPSGNPLCKVVDALNDKYKRRLAASNLRPGDLEDVPKTKRCKSSQQREADKEPVIHNDSSYHARAEIHAP
jgi:transposase InsO family protein